MQRVRTLPRCYYSSPIQGDPAAPSATLVPSLFAGLGRLGFPQVVALSNNSLEIESFEFQRRTSKAKSKDGLCRRSTAGPATTAKPLRPKRFRGLGVFAH